ncbi:hypothetical protein LJB86_04980 [Deltaproteobacteria bacterium OttesenSCG-928-M10]|nr:hypothetical protein [Deltaproteobacteria bacterium OttesenSCG-928-M10]
MDDLRSFISDYIKRTVQGKSQGFFREALVGFASAEDPLFEEITRQVGPHHGRPADFLPNGGTVVSFYLPFTESVVASNKGGDQVSWEWGVSYLAANTLINEIGHKVTEELKNEGYHAATLPATLNYDREVLECVWSHRSTALVAGLGRFGLNRMLIGPSGCAGRYGTIFVEADLPPTPRPTTDRCLYLLKGDCEACIKACPPRALARDFFDRHKCADFLNFCDVCGKCVAACPLAVA